MSATAKRAKSLGRIAAVQAELVKLAEWKLAAARRDLDALQEERRLLATFIGGEEAPGAALARAALRTTRMVEVRIVQIEAEIVALEGQLHLLKRRDKTVSGIAETVQREARREGEGRALEATMEAWLARASLP